MRPLPLGPIRFVGIRDSVALRREGAMYAVFCMEGGSIHTQSSADVVSL